jgi:hypothetical protein
MVALAATAGLAVFCFAKVVGVVLLGEPSGRAAAATEPGQPVRAALLALAAACLELSLAPGALFNSLVGLAPWPASAGTNVGLALPVTGGLPTLGLALVLAGGAALLLGTCRTSSRSASTGRSPPRRSRAPGTRAACRAGSLGAYVAYLGALVLALLAAARVGAVG